MVKKKKAKAKKPKKTGKKKKAKAKKPKKATSKTVTKIAKAKGRPMLRWTGKAPVDQVKSFPAQKVEIFDLKDSMKILDNPTFSALEKNWYNLLFHGDNKEVLGFLIQNRFKVDLVCIDPPFASNANYVRKVKLRGESDLAKLEGEDYSVGEQLQYKDIWANDSYLQFMYERLILLRELLKEKGTILVHLSSHRVHELKIILDEIFGEQYFQDEIIWVSGRTGAGHTSLPIAFNTILRYTKSSKFTYNKPTIPYTKEEIDKFEKDEKGYYYSRGQAQRELKEHEKEKYLKTYVDLEVGKTIDNVWYDAGSYSLGSSEKTGYPTQKPEKLLKRLIEMSSNEGDVVLDSFAGSGTTLAVAQQFGRKWIGCDINKGSIQTTSKRLQNIIKQKAQNSEKQIPVFAHYKINDYDLQILKSDATELAVKHLGILRNKNDTFFDGTRGKKLGKNN